MPTVRLCCRHDPVDCERETTDAAARELRRNKLRVPMATSIQFKVRGRFHTSLDDTSGEMDTHYLDVGTLLGVDGMTKESLKAELKAYYRRSFDAAVEAIDNYDESALENDY